MQFIAVPQALTRRSIRANEAWEEVRERAKRDGAKGGGGRWESRVGECRGCWMRKKKRNTTAKGEQSEEKWHFFQITSLLSDDLWHDHFFTWWPHFSLRGMMLICMRPTVTPICTVAAKRAHNLFASCFPHLKPQFRCCRKKIVLTHSQHRR